LVQPSSRFDNGFEFESAQDPLPKDTLELALRLFDREKLRLVPAIRFTSPLPELEARLRSGDAQPGILLEGPQDAATYLNANAGCPPLPLYNVLDERVQNAMIAIVHELVGRYGAHPSFAGLSIELAADTYTQLPGQLWPLDDTTIARYEHDTGIHVPGEGSSRFLTRAQFLAKSPQGNPANVTWINWRAGQLAKFYARLRAEVASNPQTTHQLYLTSTNLFDTAEAQHALRPALPPAARIDDALYAFGIRSDMILSDPGIVFLRPERLAPPGRLAAQGVDIEVNRAASLDAVLSKQSATGAVFYHEPQRTRLASFDAKNPFGKNQPPAALASQFSPAGRLNRQRFVHALATLDCNCVFDGGTMLPLGEEEWLSDFVTAFRHLPAGKFQTLPSSLAPVTVRTLAAADSTYAYLVNDSEWPATVELNLSLPAGVRMDDLSGKRRAPMPVGSTWTVSLEPYDLIAVRFLSPTVQVTGGSLTPDPRLQPTLAQNVQMLRQRLAALATPQPIKVLQNPSFELPVAGGVVPGWSLLNPAAGGFTLEADSFDALPGKPVGKQAARLTSKGLVTSLRSDPFAAPVTGRMSVVMWLRTDDPNVQPTLRLAVDGLHEDKQYYVYALVGAKQPVGQQLQSKWSPFLLQVDDLPATNLSNLRVRFDLMAAGTVWIDDIQIYELYFNADPNSSEQAQLKKIVAAAIVDLQDKQFGDCLRELDGYWPRFLNTYVSLPLAVANQPQPPVNNQIQPQGPVAPPAHQPKRPLDWLLRKS
jgi:hypothetical protein